MPDRRTFFKQAAALAASVVAGTTVAESIGIDVANPVLTVYSPVRSLSPAEEVTVRREFECYRDSAIRYLSLSPAIPGAYL